LLLCAAALPVQAQRATPLLPSDSWLRLVERRLVLLRVSDVALAARAAPLAYGELRDSSWMRARMWARLRGGVSARSGVARAGQLTPAGASFSYTGPRELDDRGTPVLLGDAAGVLGDHFAGGIEAALNDEGASVRAAYGLVRWRALQAWAGRRAFGFNDGSSSSIVLNDNTPFTGGGIALRDGVGLPILRRVYVDGMVARLPRNGPIEHPWFIASRVTVAPHPGVAIGLNRAAIFGGNDELSITPWRVFLMLIGRPDYPGKDSDFENQVASVDVLWRARVADVPVVFHGEWGADDTGFSFWHVPGVRAGFELPSVGVGVEGVYFGKQAYGYPPWYRHGALADGWTERGRLLGHPLGGDGAEGALSYQRGGQRFVGQARVYARQRGDDNLFAPARAGNSVGGSVGFLIARRGFQVEANAEGERGNGWRAATMRVTVGVSF
jgi:hypothetical protein